MDRTNACRVQRVPCFIELINLTRLTLNLASWCEDFKGWPPIFMSVFKNKNQVNKMLEVYFLIKAGR